MMFITAKIWSISIYIWQKIIRIRNWKFKKMTCKEKHLQFDWEMLLLNLYMAFTEEEKIQDYLCRRNSPVIYKLEYYWKRGNLFILHFTVFLPQLHFTLFFLCQSPSSLFLSMVSLPSFSQATIKNVCLTCGTSKPIYSIFNGVFESRRTSLAHFTACLKIFPNSHCEYAWKAVRWVLE